MFLRVGDELFRMSTIVRVSLRGNPDSEIHGVSIRLEDNTAEFFPFATHEAALAELGRIESALYPRSPRYMLA